MADRTAEDVKRRDEMWPKCPICQKPGCDLGRILLTCAILLGLLLIAGAGMIFHYTSNG